MDRGRNCTELWEIVSDAECASIADDLPETTVDLDFTLVIFPCDSELDDALWDSSNLECLAVLWVLLEEGRVLEGRGQLCDELLV